MVGNIINCNEYIYYFRYFHYCYYNCIYFMPSSSYGYVINVPSLLSQFWIRHWYNHVLCLCDKRNPATTKYIWLLIFQGCSQNGY